MPDLGTRGLILCLALALDAALGDPERLWRRIPHPVAALGWLVGALERCLNREGLRPFLRRSAGAIAALAVPGLAGFSGYALSLLFGAWQLGWIMEAAAASVLLAQRSLYRHVAAVADGLSRRGLAGGRSAVAHIVGRDSESLDEAAVARAAIESLFENFSDAVVAPAFWYLVAGLPGLLAYKAINTADSMVGHRSPRYRLYGWASARLDDLANVLPARLAGLMIAVASLALRRNAGKALRAMWSDAALHSSPNAGWPEAAAAGALDLALAGPRRYAGVRIEAAWMNFGGREGAEVSDIRRALHLYIGACAVCGALAAGAALL